MLSREKALRPRLETVTKATQIPIGFFKAVKALDRREFPAVRPGRVDGAPWRNPIPPRASGPKTLVPSKAAQRQQGTGELVSDCWRKQKQFVGPLMILMGPLESWIRLG